ncbi:Hsp70 protein-domain-containing protein [Aspergillus insuetus]
MSTKACEGWQDDSLREKLIGIQLTHRPFETRVGAIQNGQVTILKDGAAYDHYVDHINPTEDGPAVIDSRGFLGPNLLLSALGLSRANALAAGIFKQTDLDSRRSLYRLDESSEENIIRSKSLGLDYVYTPDQIYAVALKELRDLAETNIGPNITGAVVTIPPYFRDIDRENLRLAGESIGLPVVRQFPEQNSIILSLGLDKLSYETDRYVLYMYTEATILEFSVLEIHTGKIERLATTSTNLVFRNNDEIYPVVDQVLASANLTRENITDLIMYSTSYYGVHQSLRNYFPNARVANAKGINNAGIWGATLVAGWMSGEGENDWVPCCCATRRPPLWIDNGSGGSVQISNECQTLPTYQKTTVYLSCHDKTATVKVYMRGVPCVDYHAMYELGNAYLREPSGGDTLLAEFNIGAVGGAGNSTKVDVEVFTSRTGILKIRAVGVDQSAGEGKTVTIVDPHFACSDDKRHLDREYTITQGGGLKTEYDMNLKEFVEVDRDQKAVDAFEEYVGWQAVDDDDEYSNEDDEALFSDYTS